MGCLNSKDAEGAVVERERVGTHQGGESAPIAISGGSQVRGNKALGGDAALMSTSTEQRLREQEFFSRILARTTANFINVSAPSFALEGQDPYDFAHDYSHCVSTAPVDTTAVKLFSFPASACKSRAEAADLLSAPTISGAELERLSAIADGLVAAEKEMRIDDEGQPLVADFTS